MARLILSEGGLLIHDDPGRGGACGDPTHSVRAACYSETSRVCGSLDPLGWENYYLFLMFYVFIVTEGEDAIENQRI